jgi:two-component system NtrC family sensor kinase
MYDLTRFTLANMAQCGAELRRAGADAANLEAAANAIVQHLYENLRDAKGRACLMVRLYKTHPFAELPRELRDFSHDLMPSELLRPDTKCLTLLGTAGDLPEWNNRHDSRRHRSIPLPTRHAIEQVPMIAQMVRQFGLDISAVLESRPEVIDELDRRTCNVFFVPEARISPFIPAQAEFVIPHGVKSALGFGGILPPGNLFAVMMFTRVAIPMETAQMFRTIALNVKMNILRFAGGKVFADEAASKWDANR